MKTKKNKLSTEFSAVSKDSCLHRDPVEDFVMEKYEQLSGIYRSKAGEYILNLFHAQELEQDLTKKFGNILKEQSEKEPPMRCVFCKKSKDDVKKLICGPGEYCVCDECIRICADLL